MKARMTIVSSTLVLIAALFASLFVSLSQARAQAISGMPPSYACTTLSYNLRYGQRDGYAVTALQAFLNAAGYMSYPPTGYFGPLTLSAVTRFQAGNSIDTTGFVGPITRGRIQAITCGTVPPPNPQSVTIYGISPSSGPIGTTVTITGSGFTNDNTIRIGSGAMGGLAASGTIGGTQTITFTIPSAVGRYCSPGMYCVMIAEMLSPGTYPISVTNAFGTSNSVNFTVTSTSSQQLSINGIDAPTSLPIGVPGTWTVRVASMQGGTLRYSVLWGDEFIGSSAPIIAPSPMTTQSSATFTHAYARTGTYMPQFTVTDEYGRSVTAAASIVVTPIY